MKNTAAGRQYYTGKLVHPPVSDRVAPTFRSLGCAHVNLMPGPPGITIHDIRLQLRRLGLSQIPDDFEPSSRRQTSNNSRPRISGSLVDPDGRYTALRIRRPTIAMPQRRLGWLVRSSAAL